MLALEYRPTLPRYVATRAVKKLGPGALHLGELDPPRLPGPGLGAAAAAPERHLRLGPGDDRRPRLAVPVLAHLVAVRARPRDRGRGGRRATTAASAWWWSRRWAAGRAASTLPAPSARRAAARSASRVTEGSVGAGLQIGFCRETGGGWSEALVAHRSQLHSVPDELYDEDAVLIEPLACAHPRGAPGATSSRAATVAVIGAGTIGRAHGGRPARSPSRRHDPRRRQAPRPGAARCAASAPTTTCAPDRLHLEGARITGARRLVGHGGRELLLGGFDAVTRLRGLGLIARGGGHGGAPARHGGARRHARPDLGRPRDGLAARGRASAAPTATRATSRTRWSSPAGCGPAAWSTHGWHLRDYRRALEESRRAARAGRVKTVFDLRSAA